MKHQLELLIQLQDIDTSIQNLTDKLGVLPDNLIKAKKAFEQQLAIVQDTKNHIDKISKQRREKEQELDNMEERIRKMKSKTGEIKTNKEYQAYLKEIASLQEDKSMYEEEVLIAMEEIDKLEVKLKAENKELDDLKKVVQAKERIFEQEKDVMNKKIEELKGKRQQLITMIDKDIYTSYTNIYNLRNRQAVVRVENETCLGCNLNIPPQLYNDVKKNEKIIMCSQCKRILYYKETEPVSEQ